MPAEYEDTGYTDQYDYVDDIYDDEDSHYNDIELEQEEIINNDEDDKDYGEVPYTDGYDDEDGYDDLEGQEREKGEDEEGETDDEAYEETPSGEDGLDGDDSGENSFEDIPAYFPEDLLPDTYEFKDEKEELDFYRTTFPEVLKFYKEGGFSQAFIDNYENELISKEKDVDELLAIRKAVKGEDGELMMKTLFPEIALQYGIAPRLSEEEMTRYVEKHMTDTFGENYRRYFDKDDILDPKSMSSRMLLEQQRFIEQVNRHNQINWEERLAMRTQPTTPQVEPERLEKEVGRQFNEYFAKADYTENEYKEFLDELSNFRYDLQDMHRALYFDEYVSDAYQKGLDAGRKAYAKELARTNGIPLTHQQRQSRTENDEEENPYFSSDAIIARGGISY